MSLLLNAEKEDRGLALPITGHEVISHGRAKTSASSVEPLLLSRRRLTSKRGSPGGSPYRSPATFPATRFTCDLVALMSKFCRRIV
jgi:hypothetical protein